MIALIGALVAHGGELDVELGVCSHFSPASPFAQHAGPLVAIGYLPARRRGAEIGVRGAFGWDALNHRALEVTASGFVRVRSGVVRPAATFGVTTSTHGPQGGLGFMTGRLFLRPNDRFSLHVEAGPGLLVDRFGAAPWWVLGLGLHGHAGLGGRSRVPASAAGRIGATP